MYARRLAEQYDSDSKGQATYNQREPSRRGPNQQRPYYDEDDRDHSFFDDDLPEIGKTSNKASWKRKRGSTAGFTPSGRRLTAKTTKTSSQGTSKQGTDKWQGRQNFGPSQSERMYGIRRARSKRDEARDAAIRRRHAWVR